MRKAWETLKEMTGPQGNGRSSQEPLGDRSDWTREDWQFAGNQARAVTDRDDRLQQKMYEDALDRMEAEGIAKHSQPQKPDQQILRQMLDDVEAVTKARFYEDPKPYASPIEMFRMPKGKRGGEPFASLSAREKVQVLGDYTRWSEYEKHGVGFNELDQVFYNVIQGKPRAQWLEGSGLDRPLADGKTDLQKEQERAMERIKEMFGVTSDGQSLHAAEQKTTLEQFREAAGKGKEAAPKQTTKARNIDMDR